MNVVYGCIIAAAALPYIWTLVAKVGARYDNHAPRVQMAALTGWRARAYWSHQNSLEAFPLFAAAVLMAVQAGVPAERLTPWAVGFVVARILYGICYLADWATLRSIVWGLGVIATLRIMLAAL